MSGVIPSPLWLVLAASAVTIAGSTLVFADSGERALIQATSVRVAAA